MMVKKIKTLRSDGGHRKKMKNSNNLSMNMVPEIGNALLDSFKKELMSSAFIAGRKSSTPNSSKVHG
jgi:hypothetical protein